MHGNTVVTAVTLAIEGNGSKVALFSHRPRTAQAQRTVRPHRKPWDPCRDWTLQHAPSSHTQPPSTAQPPSCTTQPPLCVAQPLSCSEPPARTTPLTSCCRDWVVRDGGRPVQPSLNATSLDWPPSPSSYASYARTRIQAPQYPPPVVDRPPPVAHSALCALLPRPQVRDRRHVTDPPEMMQECMVHLREALAGPDVVPTMTVFRPLKPNEDEGPRFWNSQFIQYAGYRGRGPDGGVLGDPANVGVCVRTCGCPSGGASPMGSACERPTRGHARAAFTEPFYLRLPVKDSRIRHELTPPSLSRELDRQKAGHRAPFQK